MDIPSTAVAAAQVLVDLAYDYETGTGVQGNPARAAQPGDPDITDTTSALDALTRNDLDPALAARMRRTADQVDVRDGVDPTLPRVLITHPGEFLRRGRAWFTRDPLPEVLRQDGYDPRRYGHLAAREAQPPAGALNRGRLAVIPYAEASVSPQGAFQVTVGALTARHVADQLDSWAPRLLADQAKAARAEASTYRAWADQAETHLAHLFGWLADVAEPDQASPAFASVPAVLRGSAHLGTD